MSRPPNTFLPRDAIGHRLWSACPSLWNSTPFLGRLGACCVRCLRTHDSGAIVMAGRPMTDNLEGSRVSRFALAIGIVTACLIALFLFIGFGEFGFDKSLTPTQSPAP